MYEERETSWYIQSRIVSFVTSGVHKWKLQDRVNTIAAYTHFINILFFIYCLYTSIPAYAIVFSHPSSGSRTTNVNSVSKLADNLRMLLRKLLTHFNQSIQSPRYCFRALGSAYKLFFVMTLLVSMIFNFISLLIGMHYCRYWRPLIIVEYTVAAALFLFPVLYSIQHSKEYFYVANKSVWLYAECIMRIRVTTVNKRI
jgi:hypothetical protein